MCLNFWQVLKVRLPTVCTSRNRTSWCGPELVVMNKKRIKINNNIPHILWVCFSRDSRRNRFQLPKIVVTCVCNLSAEKVGYLEWLLLLPPSDKLKINKCMHILRAHTLQTQEKSYKIIGDPDGRFGSIKAAMHLHSLTVKNAGMSIQSRRLCKHTKKKILHIEKNKTRSK